MSIKRTYLDYNASAPLRPAARAAMLAALDFAGNPSSVHAEGRRARLVLDSAREAVATLAGARAADVVFTSGASEANATVLAADWETIFLSSLEHESVRASARQSGARVVEVAVTRAGLFDLEAFKGLSEITPVRPMSRQGRSNALVCLQLANNETGVIQPVAEVAELAAARGIKVHCDAVQVPGRLVIDCATLGADYLTLSAHKLGGPKGVGALVCVNGAPLRALIAGGGQERGRRAGTENVAAIAGFGSAARAALSEVADIAEVRALRDALELAIAHATPDAVVVGAAASRLANTSCIAMPCLRAETLVIGFDLAGIAISAGAACSSGKVGASAALDAMGLRSEVAQSAIRVSLGTSTTARDVDAFLAVWKSMVVGMARAA